jgi:hypothetical protein
MKQHCDLKCKTILVFNDGSDRKYCMSITKSFRAAVYYENQVKYINTLCRQNAGLLL